MKKKLADKLYGVHELFEELGKFSAQLVFWTPVLLLILFFFEGQDGVWHSVLVGLCLIAACIVFRCLSSLFSALSNRLDPIPPSNNQQK